MPTLTEHPITALLIWLQRFLSGSARCGELPPEHWALINHILGCQVWILSRGDTCLSYYKLQTQTPSLLLYSNTNPEVPGLCISRKSIRSVADGSDATCWANKYICMWHLTHRLFHLTMHTLLNCLLSALLMFKSLESWKVGNINTIAIFPVRKIQFTRVKWLAYNQIPRTWKRLNADLSPNSQSFQQASFYVK